MRKSYESPEMNFKAVVVEDVLSASTEPFGSDAYDNRFDLGGNGGIGL